MPKRLTIMFMLLLISLAACTSTDATPPGGDILAPLPTSNEADAPVAAQDLLTLTELIGEDPNLVFFANGLNNVGLTDDLQSGGPFTVFAPANVAFSEAGLIVSQMDPALLGDIMDNHLVDGTFSEADLMSAGSVVTRAGEPLAIGQVDDAVKVAYAPLTAEARPASNGMLYVIDTLLLPPESGPEKSMWGVLQADGRFTQFTAAIAGTKWMGTLRFGEAADAVLAPTDEAFANMPANVANFLKNDPQAMEFVISFHLLSPDGWPESADLTMADLAAMTEISTRVPVRGSGAGYGFEKLMVENTEAGLKIGGALVIEGDMDATNGSVHAIDKVLIPQVLLEDMP